MRNGKNGRVHQVNGAEHIYFIANISSKYQSEKIIFTNQRNEFAVYDPMTAKEKKVETKSTTLSGTSVELTFQPFQSVLFTFSPEMSEPSSIEAAEVEEPLLDISRGWNLEVEELQINYSCQELISWEKNEELKYYSGQGNYRKQLYLDEGIWVQVKESNQEHIQFSHIGETAVIYVNGMKAGDLFMHPYRLNSKKLINKLRHRSPVSGAAGRKDDNRRMAISHYKVKCRNKGTSIQLERKKYD